MIPALIQKSIRRLVFKNVRLKWDKLVKFFFKTEIFLHKKIMGKMF